MVNTKRNLKFAVVAVLALATQVASAQSLIYSLTYPQTTATRRIGVGHGVPPDQRVESVRSSWKTEIYSVSVRDGERKLLFSDQGPHFEIYPAEPLVAAARGKAYMKGVERRWEGMPHPGV